MSKSYRWRRYKPEDAETVAKLDAEQSARCGKSPGLQDLTKFPAFLPILLEEDGKILGGLYFQFMAELSLIGSDPMVAIEVYRLREQLKNALRMRGLRFCVADLEPSALPIGRLLQGAGFSKLPEGYERFWLDLEKQGVNRA